MQKVKLKNLVFRMFEHPNNICFSQIFFIMANPKWHEIISTPPPLAEQRRIVAEVEHRLSVADEVGRTVERSLAQAERLRQSTLKKAFEGKLVPQNPEDEPASVLLEKIRLQKVKRRKHG
jgi:hypothetical protein